MADIPIGLRHQHTLLVTSEVSIDFLGVEDARVLATPYLVWHQEINCREAIRP
jgi:predicted thioesterase